MPWLCSVHLDQRRPPASQSENHVSQCLWGTDGGTKTDEFLEKIQRGGVGGSFSKKECIFWTVKEGF